VLGALEKSSEDLFVIFYLELALLDLLLGPRDVLLFAGEANFEGAYLLVELALRDILLL
jgi:hypothetical protein